MPKPRPVEIHVNSKGRKQYKFQELIHSEKGYVFLSVDGKMKTNLFNKGFLDDRIRSIPLEGSYESCSGTDEVIAFLASEFADKICNLQLIGVVPLDRTFLICTHEADRFISTVCMDCDHFGIKDCFRKDFFCAEEDREKYRHGSWFALQKEARKERNRNAFSRNRLRDTERSCHSKFDLSAPGS